MATEKEAVFTPEDLRENFERLQADLNVVQNELDQALGVWRTLLSAEKQEFKKILSDREKAWSRDETQWEKDRQAYEQKIQDLESFFSSQLNTTEKNAVRALNELDAAWQQERARWQQTLAQQVKDFRQNEELQKVAQQHLERQLAQMTEANAQIQASPTESQARHAETHSAYTGQEQQWQDYTTSLESQVAHLQAEKASWQQSLSERFQDQQQNAALIQTLQQQVVTLEARLRESTQTQQAQERQVENYVVSLEKQIASLQEFIQQVLPSHPMRRKSDSSLGPGNPSPHLGRAGTAPWLPRAPR